MSRKKLLALNTISSLVLQVTTIICGFILPRLILIHYGSEINGLVSSITNFLSIISLLELGVGAVVQSALYKPLADNDNIAISQVIVSANRFFRNLALILVAYVLVLCCSYPFAVNSNFDWLFTVELILAISISLFGQYYFGIVNSLLLNSAQRGYFQYNAQTITLILNTIACYALIEMDASIQLVRFVTSIIYLARPAYMAWYVNKNFKINYNVKCIGEPIKQKWNGIAQHIASVILGIAPILVLTIFGSLADVSIFSVYFLVVNGIKTLVLSLTNGAHALMGELWAKQEIDELNEFFSWTEWSIHTFSVYVFGCTSALIVPFVKVYTAGVSDADYYQPLFAFVLVFAHAAHCFRLPYNLLILAAGHYKETQSNYIVASVVNFTISVFFTIKFGIIGVAIGTMVALYYQVFWMAKYLEHNLIKWPLKNSIKQLCVDGITIAIACCVGYYYLFIAMNSYLEWVCLVAKVVVILGAIIWAINIVLYQEKINKIGNRLVKLKSKFC